MRNFIGNGLALYSQHCSPRSPFLDSRWIRAIAGLDRSERLGSNFHRRAIAAAAPQLLRFPVEAGGEMEQRARGKEMERGVACTGSKGDAGAFELIVAGRIVCRHNSKAMTKKA